MSRSELDFGFLLKVFAYKKNIQKTNGKKE